jgi:hypothetical protein
MWRSRLTLVLGLLFIGSSLGLLMLFQNPLAPTAGVLFFGMFVGLGLQGHLMDIRLPATLGWMNVPFLFLHFWQPYGSLFAGFGFLALLFAPWLPQTRPVFFEVAKTIFGTLKKKDIESIVQDILEEAFKTFNPKHTPASLTMFLEKPQNPKLHDFAPFPRAGYKHLQTFFGEHTDKDVQDLVNFTQREFTRRFKRSMIDFSPIEITRTETAHQAIKRRMSE